MDIDSSATNIFQPVADGVQRGWGSILGELFHDPPSLVPVSPGILVLVVGWPLAYLARIGMYPPPWTLSRRNWVAFGWWWSLRPPSTESSAMTQSVGPSFGHGDGLASVSMISLRALDYRLVPDVPTEDEHPLQPINDQCFHWWEIGQRWIVLGANWSQARIMAPSRRWEHQPIITLCCSQAWHWNLCIIGRLRVWVDRRLQVTLSYCSTGFTQVSLIAAIPFP